MAPNRWMLAVLIPIIASYVFADLTNLGCTELIIGCGTCIGGHGESECCDCLEFLPLNVSIDIDFHCLLRNGDATCCPCSEASSPGDQCTIRDCASRRNIRILRRLFQKVDRIGDNIIQRCAPDVLPECLTDREICKLERLGEKITDVLDAIMAECD